MRRVTKQSATEESLLIKFLETIGQDGVRLPSLAGKPAYGVVLRSAGIEQHRYRTNKNLKSIIDEYANIHGFYARFQTFTDKTSSHVRKSAVSGFTYDYLKSMDLGILPSSKKLYDRVLERYAIFNNKTLDSIIGEEMDRNFDEAMRSFIDENFIGNNESRKGAISCLRKWRLKLESLKEAHHAPSLPDIILPAMDSTGITKKDLSRRLGISDTTLNMTLVRNRKSISPLHAKALCEVLDIDIQRFSPFLAAHNSKHGNNFCPASMFPKEFHGSDDTSMRKRRIIRKMLPNDFMELSPEIQSELLEDAIKTFFSGKHLTQFGVRLKDNQSLPYLLRNFPTKLQQEIDQLIASKSAQSFSRNSKRKSIWSEGTVNRWIHEMRCFFGFCCLPCSSPEAKMKGLGLCESELTLGLLAFPSVLDAYFEFRRYRTEGIDSNTSKSAIMAIRALVNPDRGWIANSDFLSNRIPKNLNELMAGKNWREQCIEQNDYLKYILDDTDFKSTRDVFEKIEPILDLKEPLEILKQALQKNYEEILLYQNHPFHSSTVLALMWRDYTMISILARLPLRAKHWSIMEACIDSTGLKKFISSTIYYRNGDLRLFVPAKEFKNARNADTFGKDGDKDLDIVFKDHSHLSSLESVIQHYLEHHRPKLAKNTSALFPTEEDEAMPYYRPHSIVTRWTQKYISEFGDEKFGLRIKGVKPFGPHAFRHIIATHIILTTGSFEAAAAMLLDSVEMVKNHYGRFLPHHKLNYGMSHIKLWTDN